MAAKAKGGGAGGGANASALQKFEKALKSLTWVSRVWYFLCFVNCALYRNYVPGMDASTEPAATLAGMNVVLTFSIGCMFAAVSQFDDLASQRKVVQYSLLGYAVWVYAQWTYWIEDFPLQDPSKQIPIYGVVTLWAALNVYIWSNSAKHPKDSDVSYTRALRVEYVQWAGWGAFYLFFSAEAEDSFFHSVTKGLALSNFLACRGAGLIMGAMMLIGAAQCSGKCQKKMLQYTLVKRILTLVWTIPATAVMMPLDKVQLVLAYELCNIAYQLHTLYPGSKRKWILRATYFTFAYAGILSIWFPAVYKALFGVAASSLVGTVFMCIAALFMAACQESHAGQRKTLTYGCVGHMALLLMANRGDDLGHLPYVSFVLFAVSLLEVYSEHFMGKFGKQITEGGSSPKRSMAMAKAATMKKRGRSKTPGAKN